MIKRRLRDFVTMLLVCGLSLFLVVYVGFGEAQRTYTQFHVEKLHAQGKILQTAMAGYLRAGLPLRQYVGFPVRADAILASDPSVASIAVFDTSGRFVFGRVHGTKIAKMNSSRSRKRARAISDTRTAWVDRSKKALWYQPRCPTVPTSVPPVRSLL